MRTVTINDIRELSPCYDPTKFLPENWEGTALDILNVTACPAQDRLWVVLNTLFLSDRDLRLFAVWCARQALAIPGNENEVCSNTCDVAERYANSEATDTELAASRAAARAAGGAWDAVDAAWAAWSAWSAAGDAGAARAAARAAGGAWDAVDAAWAAWSAWSAAGGAWAARAAARAAGDARDAARDAVDAAGAAWAAARAAGDARDAQIEHLKTILIKSGLLTLK